MQDISLTDLIDVQVLQRIQNGFSKFTGMASLTTDANGNPVTEGSGFMDFCTRYTRSTELGLSRCKECDRLSGMQALAQGKPVVYHCHAGLVDYAAPIIVEGRYLGSFLGGQIRTESVPEEQIRQTARELGLNEEDYLEAARQVKQVPSEQVQRAAEFLSEITAVLSEMAYKSYLALQQSRRLERAARSHNDFIVGMNADMHQLVLEWLDMAQAIQEEEHSDKTSEQLQQLMEKGRQFMATLNDTVEYSKISSGDIELHEKEYNVRDLLKSIRNNYKMEAREKGIEIKLECEESLPEVLLGDVGHIRQILSRFVHSSIRGAQDSEIIIGARATKKSYAVRTVFEIIDTGKFMEPEELKIMQDVFANWFAKDDKVGNMVIPMLLDKMSGTIEVDSVQGKGTVYRISIPQLEV